MRRACGSCRDSSALDFDFSYAFQPIVDTASRAVFAHEALVRGPAGESAISVLSRVDETNRYRFDQLCRVKAIDLAARLGMSSLLSINFMPNAVYKPELCIRTTLEAAGRHGFPITQIVFETVEGERVEDSRWLAQVLREYQHMGFQTAIDDFGAGFAGLNLLADFHPDIVKLDMDLIRGIDGSRTRQAIVRGVVLIAQQLDIRVIAEGIETRDEHACLKDLGVFLQQGYLFARPCFEALSMADNIAWPA